MEVLIYGFASVLSAMELALIVNGIIGAAVLVLLIAIFVRLGRR